MLNATQVIGFNKQLQGKSHAAVTLARLMAWLTNWTEVWHAYRTGALIPTLCFRRGFLLTHGPSDDPIGLLHEIFGRGLYSWALNHTLSGTALDLGANIGAVALDWTSRSPNLHVHAYEPNPATCATLRRNVEINDVTGRVCVHQEALGPNCGRTRLSITFNSLGATTSCAQVPVDVTAHCEVAQIDLNRAVRRVADERISCVKMDIEGAEASVLETAESATMQRIRRFVIEYHEELVPGCYSRALSVLAGEGFRWKVRRIYPPHTGLIFAWQE